MDALKQLIREVPDFPKPGILFYDITTLLMDPPACVRQSTAWWSRTETHRSTRWWASRAAASSWARRWRTASASVSCRPQAREAAVTIGPEGICLEYGTDALEMHADAVGEGERILIVDDLLATGGTARAVADLIGELGATVHALTFLIELDELHGRDRLDGHDLYSVLHY